MTSDASLSQFHLDALKEVLLERIDGNDRRYEARFTAIVEMVGAANTAQKEAVNAAFASAEKATAKAEEAQIAYNERSNEFRGQLDDQAKTLMPRTEAAAMYRTQDDKIEALAKQLQEVRFGVAGTAGASGASAIGIARDQQQSNWRTSTIIAGGSVIIAFAGIAIAVIALATR